MIPFISSVFKLLFLIGLTDQVKCLNDSYNPIISISLKFKKFIKIKIWKKLKIASPVRLLVYSNNYINYC